MLAYFHKDLKKQIFTKKFLSTDSPKKKRLKKILVSSHKKE